MDLKSKHQDGTSRRPYRMRPSIEKISELDYSVIDRKVFIDPPRTGILYTSERRCLLVAHRPIALQVWKVWYADHLAYYLYSLTEYYDGERQISDTIGTPWSGPVSAQPVRSESLERLPKMARAKCSE